MPLTLVAAVAMVALGCLLLLWPRASAAVAAALVGTALLVAGLLRLLDGILASGAGGARRSAQVIAGILAGLAGLYCLGHRPATVVLLSLIAGLVWVMHGIVDLVVAGSAGPGEARGAITAAGALGLLAGLVVIFWPAISLTVMTVVTGIWLICDGVLLAALWLAARRAGRAAGGLPAPRPLTTARGAGHGRWRRGASRRPASGTPSADGSSPC